MTVNEPHTVHRSAEAIQAAFARGISSESAAVFLAARQAGLGWEASTRAVAAGLAERYGTAQPAVATTAVHRPRLTMLICGMLVVYAVLRPMLGFGHELTVAALAEMLHIGVGTGVWEPIIQSLGLDPIYTGAAIRAAGGVQVTGFAVAGPIGSAFHVVWPAVFVACDQVAGGAGISMVAGPGAPAIGRGLASFGADVMWLAIGLWLFLGWRRRDLRIALLGLLIQAQIAVNHLLTAHIMLADLDASGLPRAIQLAVPNGGWFTSELAAWPEAARAVVVGVTLLILGYASSVLLLGILYAVAGGLRRALHGRRRRDGRAASAGWTGVMPRSTVLVGLAVAITAACSPVGP